VFLQEQHCPQRNLRRFGCGLGDANATRRAAVHKLNHNAGFDKTKTSILITLADAKPSWVWKKE